MFVLVVVEEMFLFYIFVVFVFSVGGEDWIVDSSSGYFGEVSFEEFEEFWFVVSFGGFSSFFSGLFLFRCFC